jgi:hypothetical protein
MKDLKDLEAKVKDLTILELHKMVEEFKSGIEQAAKSMKSISYVLECLERELYCMEDKRITEIEKNIIYIDINTKCEFFPFPIEIIEKLDKINIRTMYTLVRSKKVDLRKELNSIQVDRILGILAVYRLVLGMSKKDIHRYEGIRNSKK